MKTILTLLLAATIASAFCQTDKINDLVEKGIAYHDKGNYNNAIKKYKAALKLDPKNILVNYEIALSYFYSKEYQKSYDHSNEVIKAGKEHMKEAYIINGSALDVMGKQDEAMEVYQEGIKKFPQDHLLKYNLGLTAYNSGKYELCANTLKEGLKLNPFHASSHNLMGQLMYSSSRPKSLLAFTHFLLINPTGSNSKYMFDLVVSMLEGETNIETDELLDIGVPYTEPEDNLTFNAADLAIELMQAMKLSQEKKEKNDFALFTDNLEDFLTIMGELRDYQKLTGFWWDFYVDFFYELTKAGHGKTLGYYIGQSAHNDKVKQWIAEHDKEIDEMINWINEYYKK